MRPISGYIADGFQRKRVLLIFYSFFVVFFAGYLVAGTLLIFAIIRALHGFAFGGVTVANSTMAIDVMNPARRAEGIGFYGISNNLAMAIGPTISLYMYDSLPNFNYVFLLSLATASLGLMFVSLVKAKPRVIKPDAHKIALNHFVLTNGWIEGITLMFFSFTFGILSTYLAIYGRNELAFSPNSGIFFTILASGLILSRIVMGKSLNKGYIIENITLGMAVTIVGYLIFLFLQFNAAYYLAALIIGFGNGAIAPAYQTMFINLAANSQRATANSTYLTSWDIGIGIGVLMGGYIAQITNFFGAFCMALASCILGFIIFVSFTASHFKHNKVR